MKRTHYTVKAQRARKAWKRLRNQSQSKTIDTTDAIATPLIDKTVTEIA
ncbi:MAG: hypothetical protein WBG48_09200 [Pricia sp.]